MVFVVVVVRVLRLVVVVFVVMVVMVVCRGVFGRVTIIVLVDAVRYIIVVQ